MLREDDNANRMTEALNLFDEACNLPRFADAHMFLFLNKADLFAEKIKSVPLTTLFPDYQGGDSYEQGVEFIKQQFELRNKNPDMRIHTHVTWAVNTSSVAAAFNAVKEIVVPKADVKEASVENIDALADSTIYD